MNEKRQIEGSWFIHGQDRPPVYGVLEFDPEVGLYLNATTVHPKTIIEFFQDLASDPQIPKTIYGSDQYQNPVTLLGCGCLQNSSSVGLQTYRIIPLIALLGFKIDDWNAPHFITADIGLNLLHAWLNISGLSMRKELPLGIEIRIPPDLSVPLPGNIELRLRHTYSSSRDMGVYSVKESHILSFGFPDQRSPTQIEQYIEIFRRFLTFFTGELIYCDSINYSAHPIDFSAISQAEVLRSNSGASRSTRKLHTHHFFIPYSQIADRAPEIIKQWFIYHERMEEVLDLYFAVVFNITLSGNLNFLLLAQALEVYHKSTNTLTSIVQPTEEFSARRNAILECAPEEERDWLREKLHFANQKTLAEKLSDILRRHESIVSRFVPDTKAFANKIRHTRNYHTHYDRELRDKGKVAFGNDLFELTFQMRALVEICILDDLGIYGLPVEQIVTRVNEAKIVSV
jgi:hypothetical protein